MNRHCQLCSQQFEIPAADLSFYDKVSPTFGEIKCAVPPPTLCPDCRKRRRLSWRNERQFYLRKCDNCGKQIVSLYSPDKPFTVFCAPCWWGDSWDPSDFAQEFDFNETFSAQFRKLQLRVPRLSLFNSMSENSDYSNHSTKNKNCYMVAACFHSENVLYARHVVRCRDCVDCSTCFNGSELCYECILCDSCYNVRYGEYCKNCVDCAFVYDCIGCRNCYRSAGLRNKQYYYENKPCSKQTWEALVKSYGSHRAIEEEKGKFSSFLRSVPHLFARFINCSDCSGDNLVSSAECYDSYNMRRGEGCRYFEMGDDAKDCYDCFGAGQPAELLYEVHGMVSAYHGIAVHASYFSSLTFYSELCQNSSNLFGCVGTKRSEYCILNRPCTREEYERMVPRIIEHMAKTGEWGEFLSPALSPFGYNETAAGDYYPLEKSPALSLGFQWSDYESPSPAVERIIDKTQMANLADDIRQVPDDVLAAALSCEKTGRLYRIIKQELKFYRENNIPLPRRCPEQRTQDREGLLNPRKLWKRSCAACGAELSTTYSPARPERVLCDKCYENETL